MANKIYFKSYIGNYKYMSNFYPHKLIVDNKEYYHVEGFYQASKFIGINDTIAEIIREEPSPSKAKQIARNYQHTELTHEQSKEWHDSKKLYIMKRGVLLKFLGNYDLQILLISTGDSVLIEYAPWDEYWGAGKHGYGLNMLGKILMAVRQDVISGHINTEFL